MAVLAVLHVSALLHVPITESDCSARLYRRHNIIILYCSRIYASIATIFIACACMGYVFLKHLLE